MTNILSNKNSKHKGFGHAVEGLEDQQGLECLGHGVRGECGDISVSCWPNKGDHGQICFRGELV